MPIDEDILKADLVMLNGRVITVDGDFSISEAVAVKGNRIVAVGSSHEIEKLAGARTDVVDLRGKAVLPGLIDSHIHMLGTGLSLFMIDCRTPPMRSIADIILKVTEKVSKAKPGEWIEGRGWDQAKLAEHRNPTRWDLDKAAQDNPVILTRTCGHIAVVNSRALEIAGIERTTPQPVGGAIVKDEGGEPTGILQEGPAMILVRKHVPLPDFDRKVEAIELASKAFNEAGLTSVIEAGIAPEDMRAYQRALKEGKLTVRVNMMLRGVEGEEPTEESVGKILDFPLSTGYGDDVLRFLGLKLLIDGGIGGRTALLREHYENEPKNFGILTMPEEKFQKLIDAGNISGMNIGVHGAGGKAMDIILKAFERTNEKNPLKGRRFSIIHAYQPSEKNFEQCRELGVVIASQPSFLYYLGDSYFENVGPERSKCLKPHRAWLDNGIVVGAGTDSPVTPYFPFVSLWASIARRTEVKGTQMGTEQGVSREEAIRMYTINGAYMTFEEETKGSVEPGKLADLVVIDRNILTCPEDEIKNIKVLRTIIGGKTVHET